MRLTIEYLNSRLIPIVQQLERKVYEHKRLKKAERKCNNASSSRIKISSIRCSKCEGYGHVSLECPNWKSKPINDQDLKDYYQWLREREKKALQKLERIERELREEREQMRELMEKGKRFVESENDFIRREKEFGEKVKEILRKREEKIEKEEKEKFDQKIRELKVKTDEGSRKFDELLEKAKRIIERKEKEKIEREEKEKRAKEEETNDNICSYSDSIIICVDSPLQEITSDELSSDSCSIREKNIWASTTSLELSDVYHEQIKNPCELSVAFDMHTIVLGGDAKSLNDEMHTYPVDLNVHDHLFSMCVNYQQVDDEIKHNHVRSLILLRELKRTLDTIYLYWIDVFDMLMISRLMFLLFDVFYRLVYDPGGRYLLHFDNKRLDSHELHISI